MRVNAKTTMERVYDMEEKLDELEEALEKFKMNILDTARKHGNLFNEFIRDEVRKEVAEQVFDTLKDNVDRDARVFHMMAQMDSMEKSVKDINRKFGFVRKQLRQERKNKGAKE